MYTSDLPLYLFWSPIVHCVPMMHQFCTDKRPTVRRVHWHRHRNCYSHNVYSLLENTPELQEYYQPLLVMCDWMMTTLALYRFVWNNILKVYKSVVSDIQDPPWALHHLFFSILFDRLTQVFPPVSHNATDLALLHLFIPQTTLMMMMIKIIILLTMMQIFN